MSAARAVFGRSGYHGASLDEIAGEAGLSKGALYHNFAGKEDLFLALLDERIAERVRRLEQTYEAPATSAGAADARLRESSADAFRAAKRSGEWRLLFLEFVSHAARDQRLRDELAKRRGVMHAALTRVTERQLEAVEGELPIAAEQVALVINALANGLAVEALLAPEDVPDELLGTALGFMFRGMGSDSENEAPHRRPRSGR